MAAQRLPIVGVMGSGTVAHESLARPLGRRLARLGVHLLTGGGQGVMASVSRAFASEPNRAGLVIGVLPFSHGVARPSLESEELAGYPNRWVELPVRTHLDRDGTDPSSRNHLNILTSDVVVALPGSAGTAAEVRLAIRYGRPLILFGDSERARGLPERIAVAETADDVTQFVRRELPPELASALEP